MMKTVALIIGRFQPITLKHYQIIHNAIIKYNKVIVCVVSSKSSKKANVYRWLNKKPTKVNKKVQIERQKNPFSFSFRQRLIYQALGGKLSLNNIIQFDTGNVASILLKLEKLISRKKYQKVVIIAGSDRINMYKNIIKNYYKGYFQVDIKTIPRNVDNDISATKVRNAIKKNDYITYTQMTPANLHNVNLFNQMRKIILNENINIQQLLFEMKHIEDLKINDFIEFIEHLYETEASLKLDGTALFQFGFDEQGKFFSGAGRNSFAKNIILPKNKRYYSINDYYKLHSIHINALVSAHYLISKYIKELRTILKPNEVVNAEILFGDKPNCIKYDFKGINYLVILDNIKVFNLLKNKKIKIKIDNFVLEDYNLKKQLVEQIWKIGSIEKIDIKKYNINIKKELQELKDFLNDTTNGIKNFDILTKYKAIGKNKELVLKVREKAQKLKLNLKEKLLNNFVKQIKSINYPVTDNYSHEGIVLKYKNKLAKIIDKENFSKIHNREWKPIKIANEIIKKYNSIKAIKEIKNLIIFFDELFPNISIENKKRMIDNLKNMIIKLQNKEKI